VVWLTANGLRDNLKTKEIKQTDHLSNMERPEEFNKLVFNFIKDSELKPSSRERNL
jgi:hypothetical protein